MVVIHLLNSPQTASATVLRQFISLRTLTISFSPHVAPQCQSFIPMGGLWVSLKARSMTSHTVVPSNMEGAEHSHLLTSPQHNESIQVRREEGDGNREREKGRKKQHMKGLLRRNDRERIDKEDLSPPLIYRHKRSLHPSLSWCTDSPEIMWSCWRLSEMNDSGMTEKQEERT